MSGYRSGLDFVEANILARWVKEEATELTTAGGSHPEQIDALLDALGLIIMGLTTYSADELHAAHIEYEASQNRRNRPVLAHRAIVATVVERLRLRRVMLSAPSVGTVLRGKALARGWVIEEPMAMEPEVNIDPLAEYRAAPAPGTPEPPEPDTPPSGYRLVQPLDEALEEMKRNLPPHYQAEAPILAALAARTELPAGLTFDLLKSAYSHCPCDVPRDRLKLLMIATLIQERRGK